MTDKALLSLLMATLECDTMDIIIGSKSSRDAWLCSQDWFSPVCRAHNMKLKTNLYTIKKGSESIDKYILRVKHIRDELNVVGITVSDEDIVLATLNGLLDEYTVVKMIIEGQDSLVTLQKVRSLLLLAERDIIKRSCSGHNNYSVSHCHVVSEQSSSSHSRSVIGCQICGSKGHGAFVCRHRFNYANQSSDHMPSITVMSDHNLGSAKIGSSSVDQVHVVLPIALPLGAQGEEQSGNLLHLVNIGVNDDKEEVEDADANGNDAFNIVHGHCALVESHGVVNGETGVISDAGNNFLLTNASDDDILGVNGVHTDVDVENDIDRNVNNFAQMHCDVNLVDGMNNDSDARHVENGVVCTSGLQNGENGDIGFHKIYGVHDDNLIADSHEYLIHEANDHLNIASHNHEVNEGIVKTAFVCDVALRIVCSSMAITTGLWDFNKEAQVYAVGNIGCHTPASGLLHQLNSWLAEHCGLVFVMSDDALRGIIGQFKYKQHLGVYNSRMQHLEDIVGMLAYEGTEVTTRVAKQLLATLAINPFSLIANDKGKVKVTNFGVSAAVASSMGLRDKGGTYNYYINISNLGMMILMCAITGVCYLWSVLLCIFRGILLTNMNILYLLLLNIVGYVVVRMWRRRTVKGGDEKHQAQVVDGFNVGVAPLLLKQTTTNIFSCSLFLLHGFNLSSWYGLFHRFFKELNVNLCLDDPG